MKLKLNNNFLWGIFILLSGALITLSYYHKFSMTLTETFGFITGAWCVILVVKQNLWNFPIGILNNIFFIILFYKARLFADMGLQFVYILLGLFGWWQWLFGGKAGRNTLQVSRSSAGEALVLANSGAFATYFLTLYLQSIDGASPFLDALTTVGSLIAQYLLIFKRIENWFVWISVDIVYIGLYISRDLYLTSFLYAVFISLCVSGLIAWRKQQKASSRVPSGSEKNFIEEKP
ncbi:MAG: nicotinamide mononucleotide transporter [Leptospiraceae bacterium]|nr:nicotinamide mononucleotide transporter [Leptospiraceae bacterium]